jgi:hypothetical protein
VTGFIVNCMKKALNSPKRRFRGFMASELAEGLAKLAAQDSTKSEVCEVFCHDATSSLLNISQSTGLEIHTLSPRVVPTPGGHAHHLPAAPGTHFFKMTPDAFNPSQNAIILLQMP